MAIDGLYIQLPESKESDGKEKQTKLICRPQWKIISRSIHTYHQPVPVVGICAWFTGRTEQTFPGRFYDDEGGERSGAVFHLYRLFPDGVACRNVYETLRL